MVETPSDYQWCSYRAFIGKEKAPKWLETTWLLSCFGKNKKEGKKNYQKFVEDIDVKAVENPHKNLIGGLILGEPDFVNWIKKHFIIQKKRQGDSTIKRINAQTYTGSCCVGSM